VWEPQRSDGESILSAKKSLELGWTHSSSLGAGRDQKVCKPSTPGFSVSHFLEVEVEVGGVQRD
jgi:hypothetical protein